MKKLLLGFGLIYSLTTGIALADCEVDNTCPPPTVSAPATTTSTTSSSSSSSSSTSSSSSSSAGQVGSGSHGIGLYEVTLQEPLDGKKTKLVALNGVDLINQYISMIYMWMASIIGLIAVLMIVVSGIQIIFGGASPELVSDAKTRIMQSLLSLVLLFATALILKTVNPGFFAFA